MHILKLFDETKDSEDKIILQSILYDLQSLMIKKECF